MRNKDTKVSDAQEGRMIEHTYYLFDIWQEANI